MERHQVTRIRRETRRRQLKVASIEKITPHMLRIGFTSPELKDFTSDSYDDHIKLFFGGETAEGRPIMRDYTPRSFDSVQGTLVIDFALHDAGLATDWAVSAKVGDNLEIGGPRGSVVVPDDFDWYWLIGDETALPAIGRRIEELRAGVPVESFVLVESQEDAQVLDTRAVWTSNWISRDGAPDEATALIDILSKREVPAGEGFIWIAAEAAAARSVRDYILEKRGHPRAWTKASGYWSRGETDAHVRLDDEEGHGEGGGRPPFGDGSGRPPFAR